MTWSITLPNQHGSSTIWKEILKRADNSVDDPDGRKSYGVPDAYRREVWLTSAFDRMIDPALQLPAAADSTQRYDWHARIVRRGLVDDFMTAVLDEAWPNDDLREAFLDNSQGFLNPDPGDASPLALADALDSIRHGNFGTDDGDTPPAPDRDLFDRLMTLAAEVRVIAATSRIVDAAEDVLSAADMIEGLAASGDSAANSVDLGTRIATLVTAQVDVQTALITAKAAILESDLPQALVRLEQNWPEIGTSVHAISAAAHGPGAPDLLRLRDRCRFLLERLTETQHLALSDLRFGDLFEALKDFLRLLDAGADAWYVHLRALVIGLRQYILAQSLWREIETNLLPLLLKIKTLAQPELVTRTSAASALTVDIFRLQKRLTWLDKARMDDKASDWCRPVNEMLLILASLGAGGLGGDEAPVRLDDLVDRLEDHFQSLNASLRLENRAALRKSAAFIRGMEQLSSALECITRRMVNWGLEVPADG